MALINLTGTFWDWIILLAIVATALYWYGTSTHSYFSKRNIPYDKPLPFVGSMGGAFLRREYFPQIIQRVYNQLENHQYGGFFSFLYPVLLIKDPELIKTIAVKDFEYFTDHKTVLSEDIEPLFTRGLFSLKGQRWRDMRSTLSPAFTSSKMKTMFVLVSECCRQFVKFLEECYKEIPKNGFEVEKDGDLLVLEMKSFYTRFTSDVIATTAFGVGVDSLKQPKNEFYMMGQDFTNIGGLRVFRWLGYMMFPKLMETMGIRLISSKVTTFFTSLVLDTIATRGRESIVRPDMLQLLMEAQRGTLNVENIPENNSTKRKLEDKDIIAQALLFFLAGFDTSSTLLCFVSHQLAVHTNIQTRLQEEIQETLQENGGKFTYDAIHNMKYLDMVVSETLRLYPPAAAVDRICVKPYTLKADPPLEMKPDDNLFLPIYALHRDPKYFSDPDQFDPERFSDENKHKINPITYIPFGVGPRSCIGNRFALMEAKLALVYLLASFNIKVIAKTPIPIEVVQKGFNISINGGFWLGLEPRNLQEVKTNPNETSSS